MSGSKVFKLFGSVIASKKSEPFPSSPNGISSPSSDAVASPAGTVPVSPLQVTTHTTDLPITVMTDPISSTTHANTLSGLVTPNTSPSTIQIKQEPNIGIGAKELTQQTDLPGISNSPNSTSIQIATPTTPIKSLCPSPPVICITDSVIEDALANCTGEDKKEAKRKEAKTASVLSRVNGKSNNWNGRNGKDYGNGFKDHKKGYLEHDKHLKPKYAQSGSWSAVSGHYPYKRSVSHDDHHVSHYSPSLYSSPGRKRPHSPSYVPISPHKRTHSSSHTSYDRPSYSNRFKADSPHFPLPEPLYPLQDSLYPLRDPLYPPLPYSYPFVDEFALSSLSLPYPAPYPPAFLSPQSLNNPLYSPFANFNESSRDDYHWKERERKEDWNERGERWEREEKYERRERDGRDSRREWHDEFYVKEGTKLYLENVFFSDEEIMRLFEGVAKVRATSTGRRGFCFVYFETLHDRDKAAEYLAKFHPSINFQECHTNHKDRKLLHEDKLKRTPSQVLYVGLANCDRNFDIKHSLRDFKDEVVEFRRQKDNFFIIMQTVEGAIRVKEFLSKYYPNLQVNYHVRRKN